MARLHQWIPVLDPGDAASNHTLQMQQLLHDMGLESEIFTDETHPALTGRTRPYRHYPGGPVLYQMAIGSPLADALAARPDPLAVDYHNFTPAELFEAWDPGLVHGTNWGRRQLEMLSPRASIALAVSPYNERDLAGCGYRRTAVAPLLLDLASFDRETDDELAARLRATKGDGVDWLFIGRIVPNKCQHDIVKAFAAWRRGGGTGRLWLVGGASSIRYESALHRFVDGLGLRNEVSLTGAIPSAQMAAYLATSDVFVCLSQHEGFCAPIIEAMYRGVPVVGYDAAAVGDTVGAGGVVLADKDPACVATAVDRVVSDRALRTKLIAAGRRRAGDFSLERSRARRRELLLPWLSEIGEIGEVGA